VVQSVASVVAEVAQTGSEQAVAFLAAEVAHAQAYAAVAAVAAEVAGVFPAAPTTARRPPPQVVG
jgi:hypothetical protein